MKRKKGFTTIALFISVVVLGSATSRQKEPKHQYKNLKVLPGDISSKDLQGMMTDDFEDGLGVSCGFCHASATSGHGLDFASDAKAEKEIARKMMRMTIGLNKKYFNVKRPMLGGSGLVVTCVTCHKGQAFPEGTEP